MRSHRFINLTLVAIILPFFHLSHGCWMEGIANWQLVERIEVKDTFRGVIFERATENITAMTGEAYDSDNLKGGPYWKASFSNSKFIIETNDNFNNYEENETADSSGLTVYFSCVGRQDLLVFTINVIDTNNNDPLFRPNNEYEFTLTPPLAPGYKVTDCINDIIVRDIDLTTQRIDFVLTGSPDFELNYDSSSTVAKEFKTSLRTSTFIRSIPESIELRISATDVDLTGDPPRTTYATIRIKGSGSFELPDDLIFTQTFYISTYSRNNTITLQQQISLRRGYDEEVKFSLDADSQYSQYFELSQDGNSVNLLATPLPGEVLTEQKLFLVIRADRENTSGTSATIIVQLPELVNLEFQQPNYNGQIVDNVLQLDELILTQGYDGETVFLDIVNDYSSYFGSSIQDNRISLTMSPLAPNIIEENTFLNLQVIASTNRSSASSVVTLEIIKDDSTTPVFERATYVGSYGVVEGLTLDEIVITQGYDSTVQISLKGEYANYFQVTQSGPRIVLNATTIPTELFREHNILLTVEATKPRTVGANAAVSISLPPEIELLFEQPIYNGVIEDNSLQISDLFLSQGYNDELVTVTIQSDYSSYFKSSIQDNRISLTMSPLAPNIIEENTFLNLQVIASTNRSSASSVVTLEIIKDDSTTPVFERATYVGSYGVVEGLMLDEIVITQGYDSTVQITLKGEHAKYFQISQSGPRIVLNATTIPTELFREHIILLTVEATKPRTVGANAVVSISLPPEIELEFEQSIYNGVIEDNSLQISDLLLSQGYNDELVTVTIQSDYAPYFSAIIQENRIQLNMLPLESNIIEENPFLTLLVVASTVRSSTSTVVTLEIIKDDSTTPKFERNVYSGSYDPTNGLTLDQIVIIQGYDTSVRVSLTGEHASYFQIIQSEEFINLTSSLIPVELFGKHRLLLSIEATKPRTVGANSAITIALPERNLRFEADSYKGTIYNKTANIQTISLYSGYDNDVEFMLSGNYASYFILSNVQNQVSVDLLEQLPDSVILENNFLQLTLTASASHAITTMTSLLFEIIKEDITTPVFSQSIYYATYEGTNMEIKNINLKQGYDDTVSFHLNGEYAQYFIISNIASNLVLTVRAPIPEEIIFNEKVLLLYVTAEKPLTVGANAAVRINFPSEFTEPAAMKFSRNTYIGSLDQKDGLILEEIILDTGYATGTEFFLTGEHEAYFALSNANNIVTITLNGTLPSDFFNNKFVSLAVEARRARAVSVSTTIIIDVLQSVVVPLVFEKAYYRGVYTQENDLQVEQEILLSQGYDESLVFLLEGDFAEWFSISQILNSVIIHVKDIPEAILKENNHLVFAVIARKPEAVDARTVLVIDLPKDTPLTTVLRFAHPSYVGQIENDILELPPVTLVGIYDMPINLNFSGEYASYFNLSLQSNTVSVQLIDNLPSNIAEDNKFIILNLEASYPEAISGFATIIFELKDVRPSVETPVFEEAYYIGEYSELMGLEFEHTIRLTQGFEETVTFTLAGEDAQAFNLIQNGPNNLTLSVNDKLQQVNNGPHLIFSIVANNGASSGQAAIIITLTDTSSKQRLRFEQDYYQGSLENNNLSLSSIKLVEGFSEDVTFSLKGVYADFFQLSQQDEILNLQMTSPISQEIIDNLRTIIMTLEAEHENIKASTAIIIEVIKSDDLILLDFEETYYIGSYSAIDGLFFDRTITLAEGHDESVEFSLQGENSQWFAIRSEQNAVRLTLASPIPPAVIANNQQLLFTIVAERPGSRPARATIVIQLTEEVTENQILGFDRTSYVGSVENNTVQLTPIVLREGYTSNVTFQLYGDFAKYFALQSQEATVTISLVENIPEDTLPPNRIVLLDIEASAPQSLSAFATIVFEVILDDDEPSSVVELAFEETYYIGSYSAIDGLVFDRTITLAEGHDESVEFSLQGENSQWFAIRSEQNAVRLTLASPIPPAVIANNQQLLFTIVAERPGSRPARATIVIQLTEEVTENQILGFDRTSYVGSVENNTVQLKPIVLREGYTSNVTFQLYGDFAKYFALQSQEATVTISLVENIPEDTLPPNRIVLLDIEASAPQSLSAFATIVFEVILDDDEPSSVVELAFEETYYIGSYSAIDGLVFDRTITLAEGHDESVEFSLQGENSQWFAIRSEQNAVRLTLASPIPPAVIANNQQLLFTIVAERPGSRPARATIVIQLTEEVTENQILGFDRTSYVGSVENNTVQLTPIVLREGYTSNVTFQLYGDFAKYFALQSQEATVTISLIENIPEDTLPPNRIVLLDIEASAPQSLSAFATIVFEVILDDDEPSSVVELAFEETYYIGSYSAIDGLVFDRTITLAEGHDESVEFSLQGENSQWFAIRSEQNAVRLTLASPIPPAVIANNQQLLFTIVAERPGSRPARATIVIQLTEEVTENQILGFDRTSYVGSVENNTVQLTPIVLREGYTSNVTFQLYGDFAKYFALQSQEATVTISLVENIPEDTLPPNRIILLDIEASAPQSLSAFATIVFEVILDDDEPSSVVELAFEETYYIGSYSAIDGLVFDRTITLAEGHDESVEFSLQGENSQWFAIRREQNAVRLTLASPIPPAVIANNQQLLFTIVAERPGSRPARATIVIQLTEEVTENQILGFDRTSYVGSVENNTVQLTPIVLREGYTSNVMFQLYGDFAKYFALQSQEATVTISLVENIPEDTLPPNRIVLLDIEASAPQSLSAFATIVFEVILDDDEPSSVVELAFEETYYIGSYSAIDGLVFDRTITLAEGHDESVEFSLQGENSQWFAIRSEQNAVRLTLASPIPPAVIANNQQLLFTIVAVRPGSKPARATIVIQLTEEVTENQILGFDRTSYVGSVENNTVQLTPIVLREGYTSNVTFQLYGDFAKYFALQSQEATVTISLVENIPEDTLPPNRIVLLDIEASAPQSLSAFATIVFAVILDDDEPSSVVELAFEETYYIGSYSAIDGLVFDRTMTLAEGHDESVEFSLQGENSQWFAIRSEQNAVRLTLASPIPPAVIANNQQLLFTIVAERPGSRPARATIVIQLTEEVTENQILGFDRTSYVGSVENNTVQLTPIVLREGYTSNVTFQLYGDFAKYFALQSQEATVTISLVENIPEDTLPPNRIVLLDIEASAPQSLSAFATIVFEVILDDDEPSSVVELAFEETYYIGSYSAIDGLVFDRTITLAEGHDESVEFSLQGENSQWFAIRSEQNAVRLTLASPIPPAVIANNQQLLFTIVAERPSSRPARATIVIQLTEEVTENQILGFDRTSYVGSVENNTVQLTPIVLREGYTSNVTFQLYGDFAKYFALQSQEATVTISLVENIPEDTLPPNRIVLLDIEASAPQSLSAFATIVFEVILDDDEPSSVVELAFEETYYIGSYSAIDGLVFDRTITLAEGHDESVEFSLQGENSQWFAIRSEQNAVRLTLASPIPPAVIANNQQLLFTIVAERPGSRPARATIVIQLTEEVTENQILGFDRTSYVGSVENNTVQLTPIVLREGYTSNVTFQLYGDFAKYFALQSQEATVTISLVENIPEDTLPPNRIVLLDIEASAPQSLSAFATIVFEVILDDDEPSSVVELAFEETYYIGSYSAIDGLVFDRAISLAKGYDESVVFSLQGESSQWFGLNWTENSVQLTLLSPIPPTVVSDNTQLIFAISAEKFEITATATIVIQLEQDTQTDPVVAFDKVLYEGIVQDRNLQHETITLSGYDETEIDIFGVYAALFSARVEDGVVNVEVSHAIPADVNNVILELRAGKAGAVLILQVQNSEVPEIPTVSFSASSYVIRVEMGQTGQVGTVRATADNGEALTYSLQIDDEHLQARLSVSSSGELRLSAPADTGIYNIEVAATTVATRATATAPIRLTVEEVTPSENNDIVTAPLIVIDRDEEQPHMNLVTLDPEHSGCQYSLTNRWPENQNWLYVDKTGLHSRAIDREDPSIAFMALSQVQVELTLHCDCDATRTKRSADARLDWLGPYDYGTNTWVLGDSIKFNPRRSIVNLIVNDINDNTPIFVGKENEPIVVGYPMKDLETAILPRSLTELQARDADVGENAALLYWSSQPELAVSPTTGYVHVRNNVKLEENMLLTVNATDRNGNGLTGSISLMVKLLDTSKIAVITVRNSFLEDESRILGNLSNALGYDVRPLRSVVISDQTEEEEQEQVRIKRDTDRTTGSSLQIYVYGLIEREPISVDRLASDINDAAIVTVNIASIQSLEDHLEGQAICDVAGRDTGLLAATIVLSILLFILIIAIVVWFLLTRKKAKNYDQFSDANSIVSQIESPSPNPKPDAPMPRLNIEELKRSERRLQDMLNAPIDEVKVEPTTSSTANPVPKIPSTDSMAPIVIQDKLKDAQEYTDDEDEFGERKEPRRKSVVTFNENVEKIIPVEDPDQEVYKL